MRLASDPCGIRADCDGRGFIVVDTLVDTCCTNSAVLVNGHLRDTRKREIYSYESRSRDIPSPFGDFFKKSHLNEIRVNVEFKTKEFKYLRGLSCKMFLFHLKKFLSGRSLKFGVQPAHQDQQPPVISAL